MSGLSAAVMGRNYPDFAPKDLPDGWSAVIALRTHYEIVLQTRLPAGENPPIPRTRTNRPREFDVERKDEHHDDGLAHDAWLLTRALRLLHLGRQSQLRDDSAEQAMRDQHSHNGPRERGRGHRQLLGGQDRQVQ